MRKLFVVIVLVCFVAPVHAVEIAGVSIEEEIVNQQGTKLLLNGAGIRKKLFFKIYIAELFLEEPASDAKSVLASDKANRIVMHFLYDEVGKEKIIEGWNEGFSANNDAASLKQLQARIDTFNAMFSEDMKAGDRVVFGYTPGEGTQVSINDTDKGVVDGKDFNEALLAIWLGNHPVSTDLREQLLGQ